MKSSKSYFDAESSKTETRTMKWSKNSPESNHGSYYERDDDRSHSHAYFYIGPVSENKLSKQLLEDKTSSTTIKLDTEQNAVTFSNIFGSIYDSFENIYIESKKIAQQLLSKFYESND